MSFWSQCAGSGSTFSTLLAGNTSSTLSPAAAAPSTSAPAAAPATATTGQMKNPSNLVLTTPLRQRGPVSPAAQAPLPTVNNESISFFKDS